MNVKQIAGFAVAALGIFLIGYGAYSKMHVSTAQREIHKMTESKNPIVRSAGKEVEKKIGSYGTKMNWSFFGGGIFILVGLGAAYFYRKKNRK